MLPGMFEDYYSAVMLRLTAVPTSVKLFQDGSMHKIPAGVFPAGTRFCGRLLVSGPAG